MDCSRIRKSGQWTKGQTSPVGDRPDHPHAPQGPVPASLKIGSGNTHKNEQFHDLHKNVLIFLTNSGAVVRVKPTGQTEKTR